MFLLIKALRMAVKVAPELCEASWIGHQKHAQHGTQCCFRGHCAEQMSHLYFTGHCEWHEYLQCLEATVNLQPGSF